MDDLDTLQREACARIADAGDLAALEALRVEYLGKQGSVSALMKTLGAMVPEERQAQAPRIQGLRQAVADALATRKAAMEKAELEQRLATETLDLTLPAPEAPRGSVHPVSQVMDELAEIFADMGFAVATGPEIEDDWHNFTALNMPESHPARAMHDTFYFPDAAEDGPASSSEAVGRTK
ncbi:MAG TPA: phenylalanine--tRNA ligase subunit alpha, partial [Burkholderiales bacterium]